MTATAIRDASVADAPRIVALWQECGLTRPWNDPDRDLTDALTGETSTVLVAEVGGTVVGTVMAGHDGHRGWLYYLAVDPRFARRGYGSRLVVAAEAWLAGRGARKVQLMVRAGNEVSGFYAALGYTDQATTVLGRWLDPDDGPRHGGAAAVRPGDAPSP